MTWWSKKAASSTLKMGSWCSPMGRATRRGLPPPQPPPRPLPYTASIGIYTDGGTTAILNQSFGTVSNAAAYHLELRIFNASARKSITGNKYSDVNLSSGHTATANTGFVNALQLTHGGASNTMTLCTAVLYGWRR